MKTKFQKAKIKNSTIMERIKNFEGIKKKKKLKKLLMK